MTPVSYSLNISIKIYKLVYPCWNKAINSRRKLNLHMEVIVQRCKTKQMGLHYTLLFCRLPTPLTLVCGGGKSDHTVLGPPASLSLHLASCYITPAGSVHKSRGASVVRMWVKLKIWCVWVLQRGNSGDECDLTSTLCKYDLRKGDLFVLSWARVGRVRRGSISSKLIMRGGGVRSIFLLSRVARCLETIDVCIWHVFVFYVCCSDCVGLCGNICCVAAVVKNSVFFLPWSVEVCCVFV